jgi:hypothetical protein
MHLSFPPCVLHAHPLTLLLCTHDYTHGTNGLFLIILSCSLETITALENVRKVHFETNGNKQKFGNLIHLLTYSMEQSPS